VDFTLTLGLGAALLAVWLDTRLAARRPKGMAQGFKQAILGVLALNLSVALLEVVYGIPDAAFMALVLTVFLGALVYAMLGGLWLARVLADEAGLARR
jgi:hypothetical protein